MALDTAQSKGYEDMNHLADRLDLPQVCFVNQKKLGKGKLGKGKEKGKFRGLLFHADLLQMTKQTWDKSTDRQTMTNFGVCDRLLDPSGWQLICVTKEVLGYNKSSI